MKFLDMSNIVLSKDIQEYSSTKQVIQYPTTKVEIMKGKDEQNILFGQLMRHIQMLQQNISSSNSIILYGPHVESGLGNTVIGLVSSLVSALATNRGFQSM